MNTILIGNGYWSNIIQPKLEAESNLLGILDSKSDLDKALSDEKIDWVFICTPTNTHYDLVLKSLYYNKNVFCEKPFTGDLLKAKSILSQLNGNKLYIDNTFLLRDEIKNSNIEITNSNNIYFEWTKKSSTNENIFDSWLYHDIYLLLELIKEDVREIKINALFYDEENLVLSFLYNDRNIYVSYDRNCENANKKIIKIDDVKIDLSRPKNDPLLETIIKIKNNEIDYNKNHTMTMKTLEVLIKIKTKAL